MCLHLFVLKSHTWHGETWCGSIKRLIIFDCYIWLGVGCGNTIHDRSKCQRNQLHTDAREGGTVISRMVWVFFLTNSEVKKTSCLATQCLHAKYLVVTINNILKNDVCIKIIYIILV